ncbi:Multifunctional non-homologous end joining protein LigD [bioreactor metagenome]|uniref:Multifunctional non-homologous end joining protein LigD n=1 Tax=bioreactor metagenome TaxID=1076179 RepID=A0A644TFA4_9ZZZZ|nr:non-homologous end-joining DNA ligase [Negativicutes bacterium]
MPSNTQPLLIDGVKLQVSNLNKVFYPDNGFTKGQMIDYYIRIAPALLPHLTGRPLTLKRYPNGAAGKFFYQKECPKSRPSWLPTVPVWSNRNKRPVNYCLIENLPSLVWAANLASLELHTSLSLANNLLQPSIMVFDLDPGPPATIVECTQVALWLRDFFTQLHMASFPKTSGSKGLQVYVPLNTEITYEQTKHFAHSLARMLETKYPSQIVSNMRKNLRTGKVFIDWSQNDGHKTTVCVYSLRARNEPTVSTPVTWTEVEKTWNTKTAKHLEFTSTQVLERFLRLGDLFHPVLTIKQHLPHLYRTKPP